MSTVIIRTKSGIFERPIPPSTDLDQYDIANQIFHKENLNGSLQYQKRDKNNYYFVCF